MDDLTAWRMLDGLDQKFNEAGSQNQLVEMVALAQEAYRIAFALNDRARYEGYAAIIGSLLAELGHTHEALSWLEPVVEHLERIGRPSARPRLWLARSLRAQGRRDEAIAIFGKAIMELDAERDYAVALGARFETAALLIERGTADDLLDARSILRGAADQVAIIGLADDRRTLNALNRKLGHDTGPSWTRLGALATVLAADDSTRIRQAVNAAAAARYAGDYDYAEWLMQHVAFGIDNVRVPIKAVSLKLRLNIAYMIAGSASLRGDTSGAVRALRQALDRVPDDWPRMMFGVRFALAQVLSALAVMSSNAGDDEAAESWAQLVLDGLDKHFSRAQRAELLLEVSKIRSGDAARHDLDRVLTLANDRRTLGIRCEALQQRAAACDDPEEALSYLDQAATVLSKLESRHPANVIDRLRRQTTLGRVQALALTDPVRAAAALSELNYGTSDGAGYDELRFRLDRVLGSDHVSVSLEPAVAALVQHLETAGSWARRDKVFLQLRKDWAAALDILATRTDHHAALLALQLIEVSNRGTLAAFAYRGAAVGLALADTAQKSGSDTFDKRLRKAAETLRTSSRRSTKVLTELRGRPALVFAITAHERERSARGVRVAIDSHAQTRLSPFTVTGAALRLLELARLNLYQSSAAEEGWADLSRALLGDDIDNVTSKTSQGPAVPLLIVTGSSLLAGLPWCAMTLGDGEPLLSRTPLQFAPSLSLLTGAPAKTARPDRALLYAVDYPDQASALNTARERAAMLHQRQWRPTPADTAQPLSKEAFLEALAGRDRWAIGYIAAHGGGSGAGHRILHADGSALAVADALDLWWPELVILSSCHVGTFKPIPGADPLGIPLACLLRGASYVIGCNEAIGDAGASSIGAAIIEHLAAGAEPANAVQAAQQQWLASASPKERTFSSWAPFQVISLC